MASAAPTAATTTATFISPSPSPSRHVTFLKPCLKLPSQSSLKCCSQSQTPISTFFSSSSSDSSPQIIPHDIVDDDDNDEKPREECGVVGIYGDPEASRLCYLSLHALQHRGQEGAGIVTVNDDGVLQSITGVGLVSDVFNQSKLDQLPGNSAIGHVRYSTAVLVSGFRILLYMSYHFLG